MSEKGAAWPQTRALEEAVGHSEMDIAPELTNLQIEATEHQARTLCDLAEAAQAQVVPAKPSKRR